MVVLLHKSVDCITSSLLVDNMCFYIEYKYLNYLSLTEILLFVVNYLNEVRLQVEQFLTMHEPVQRESRCVEVAVDQLNIVVLEFEFVVQGLPILFKLLTHQLSQCFRGSAVVDLGV